MSDHQNIQTSEALKPGPGAKRRRLILIALVALVVLAGIAAGNYFYLSRPVGEGPAGPSASKEQFGIVWMDRPVHLVGLGDSITAGFGASADHSYFDRLVESPTDEFPDMQGICLSAVLPNLSHTNLAISGSTSLQHLRVQLPRIQPQHSNVLGLVVMTTGGNDIIHNYGKTSPVEGAMFGATFAQAGPWIQNFEKRLSLMIEKIRTNFPGGCHVFLANIYDPTDGLGDIELAGLPPWRDGPSILKAYNTIIADCAAKHPEVHLVNIHEAFLGHGIHCTQFWNGHYQWGDPHYWYHQNLEDPNDRGYDALRRLFLNAIANVLLNKKSRE